MPEFDDGLLDDPQALEAADGVIRPLAEAGARLRREAAAAAAVLAGVEDEGRPRAVVAVGPEARLLRAVLEPSCPVPFVAWPSLGLPGWVGPLDLVVVLGGAGREAAAAVHEATRRGSRLIVTAPPDSPVAQEAGRSATLLPSQTSDPLCGAITVLMALHRLGLGPVTDPSAIADVLDDTARACSYALDIAANPAKSLALELADALPLVWGGSVLAARASRRIAEALRAASGRVALAADFSELNPILAEARPRDPFDDPFDGAARDARPALVIVDDGAGDPAAAEHREVLEANAQVADARVCVLEHLQDSSMERYAGVLQRGLFAAAYLQVGMGRA
ncbi:SIS domain-containing protein [Nigerium massiliense]|uniref:SIS domain-containing protein n=1 Tax=Nigerium massiliense TaxID=1522317 RepID=UPI00059078DC|nr:SIS domain-containing protein [Nigerium massiliense]